MSNPMCPGRMSRRRLLAGMGVAAAGGVLRGQGSAMAPTAPVAVAKCATYGPEVTATLDKMFDQLGGLGRIVKGKTVAIKVNLTGLPTMRLGYAPVESTTYTHPAVIGAAIHLMDRAGARRIRIVECAFLTAEPLAEFMLRAGWEPRNLANAGARVEFENTNFLGSYKSYARLMVPGQALLFSGFDFNRAYEECDVMVSMAKLKEHATAGVTLSIKNMFGTTPCTIYGDQAGENEPSEVPRGGRGRVFHLGERPPSKGSLAELDPTTPRIDHYRIPRVIVDIVKARPVHLAIIDGIQSMAGGEGAWNGPQLKAVSPGILVAGTNPVTTDAVGTALMGFDPMAERGTAPFELCDSTLQLAEMQGLGTRDLKRIDVVGTPIKDAAFPYRPHWLRPRQG
jgi:uncharacterized protein (DUF362 family)